MPEIPAAEREEALRRQLENLADRAVGGWKVGLTSGAARDSMGKGFRPFGYILRERIFETGTVLRLHDFERVGVENELCFRIRNTLRGEASRAEVIAALDGVHAAFEINEQRLGADASPTERIADNLNQWGIVVGHRESLDWQRFDFDQLAVSLLHNADTLHTVAAQGHIDDHFDSIATLVRQLDRFGRALEAGAHVITGSFTRHSIARAGVYRGKFSDPFRPVHVEFQ